MPALELAKRAAFNLSTVALGVEYGDCKHSCRPASGRFPKVVNLVNWSQGSRSSRVMDVWKPPKTPLGQIHRENSPRDAAMEVVTLSSDERSAAISGRVKVSLWLKFNPI